MIPAWAGLNGRRAIPLVLLLAANVASAACAPTPPPPGGTRSAPAEASSHGHATPASGAASATPLPPDAEFLHHMIPHHAQALQMTSLVPERTTRQDLRMLAERIAVSQRDEIAQMEGWLRREGHPVPAADTGSHGAHAPTAEHAEMPGMLTQQELARLAAARGASFDRHFLEAMIRHHEGAIAMVQQLFARGGAQNAQLYTMASDIESDQRLEIARMRALLDALPSAPRGDR